MSTSNAPGSPDSPGSPESPASAVPDRPGRVSRWSFAAWTTRRALGAAVVVLLGLFLVVWAVRVGRQSREPGGANVPDVPQLTSEQPNSATLEAASPEAFDHDTTELGPVDRELLSTSLLSVELIDLIDFTEPAGTRSGAAARLRAVEPTQMSFGTSHGSGVGKRGATGVLVRTGNTSTEAAVARALRWIAVHQWQDGGWSFDLGGGVCQGQCSHSGKLDSARNGATGLALLALLGAGHTHKEGQYRQTVRAGLEFLKRSMKRQDDGGSLVDDGGMVSHGIGSLALCELYAMTGDPQLKDLAQDSIDFIVHAQDPVGGGWQHSPRKPGETAALGWQVLALKSGHAMRLNVPPPTAAGAVNFLDSVRAADGFGYGSTGPGSGRATTAVGLASRLYLVGKNDASELRRGVQYLSTTKLSRDDMIYNFHATLVLGQSEGASEEWQSWLREMREWLVEGQSREGHENGSWMMPGDDPGAETGGRLYCTAMAAMILEVYYRHLPIYGRGATADGL